MGFQSTHPQRVRLHPVLNRASLPLFQSTHPQRVRLHRTRQETKYLIVSIHAPTKGATTIVKMSFFLARFQSTHPQRVRQVNPAVISIFSDVSIHAPTKGATRFCSCMSAILFFLFQSTHPQRVRLFLLHLISYP